MTNTFHSDTKYCPCCDAYVRYLASLEQSYCVECGSGDVRMFSDSDWTAFQEKMEARKNKGGRPRKNARRQAAVAQRAAA